MMMIMSMEQMVVEEVLVEVPRVPVMVHSHQQQQQEEEEMKHAMFLHRW